eukprot:15350878-Ditylum_brightwellii.AAC.1
MQQAWQTFAVPKVFGQWKKKKNDKRGTKKKKEKKKQEELRKENKEELASMEDITETDPSTDYY